MFEDVLFLLSLVVTSVCLHITLRLTKYDKNDCSACKEKVLNFMVTRRLLKKLIEEEDFTRLCSGKDRIKGFHEKV